MFQILVHYPTPIHGIIKPWDVEKVANNKHNRFSETALTYSSKPGLVRLIARFLISNRTCKKKNRKKKWTFNCKIVRDVVHNKLITIEKQNSKVQEHTVSTSIGSIFLSCCKWPVTFGSKTLPMKPYTWAKSGSTANKRAVWVLKSLCKWN